MLGTATAGADYTTLSLSVTIPANTASAVVWPGTKGSITPPPRHVGRLDGRYRERADTVAVGAQVVHLRDALVERAALQRHAERARFERARFFAQAMRAGIALLAVTPDAVMRLILHVLGAAAGVRERKALALSRRAIQAMAGDDLLAHRGERHEVLRVQLVRLAKQHAARVGRLPGRRVQRPGGVAQREIKVVRVLLRRVGPGIHLPREGELRERFAE